MSFPCLHSLAGPSSVQYQHGTPVLYQAQSGSPPATGLPRVSLATSQQGPAGHTTGPLAQGIPQQQQVMCCGTRLPVLNCAMFEESEFDCLCR